MSAQAPSQTNLHVYKGGNAIYQFTAPPPPPKHLPTLHKPNPIRKNPIQYKIRSHSRNNPRRRCRFPAQIPVRVESGACDRDGCVAQQEADVGEGVILGEGVGGGEGG